MLKLPKARIPVAALLLHKKARISFSWPFNGRHLTDFLIICFMTVSLVNYSNSRTNSQALISPLVQGQAMYSQIIEPKVITKNIKETSAEESDCLISDTFSPSVKKWENDICRWSKEHDIDADLVATIMQIESCGNNNAVSATGVRGLFQVTGANLDGENPFDPNVSMAKGPGKVLKNELSASGGNVRAAMAGYNGGGKAREYIAGNITRNQFYSYLRNHPSRLWWSNSKALAKINEVERYAQWANIYYESKESKKDTLQEWWDLGGYRLCEAT